MYIIILLHVEVRGTNPHAPR